MNTNDLKRLASAASSSARARRATDELTERAVAEGLVDVAVATMDSPIGELFVAVTPTGLVSVAFEDEPRDEVLERIVRQISPRVLEVAAPTDEVRRELEQYFHSQRRSFDLSIDRRLIGDFAWSVLRATSRVGYGELATYGQIAARIHRPTAARAVGRALGSNPIPIVIPCHRVVGAGGSLTGYAGGLPRKQTLLRLEGSLL
ncbi:MAG TPA: methylated-DNA--[protein]-cysteine S-methyltransferase [Actinomycetota bacterium]|nr:methylated-DNA--[protein]-cysteine S-methyltransferase [Actinomycetota bacterium]